MKTEHQIINQLLLNNMTFIIHFKDGSRQSYSNRYDEDVEHERDAAWDDVYSQFPEAEYIESF